MAPCHEDMQDMELVDNYLKTRAAPCFNILDRRYASKIFSKCLSMLKNEAEAYDAKQEIFIKLITSLDKFRGKSKFSTWIYSITYNYCIDFLRRRKKMNNLFSDELENPPDTEAEEVPDEYLTQMKVDQLRRVLEELAADDKAVLLMKYQAELSIREIAESLKISESAVKMRIKRAKERAKQIREQLYGQMEYA